MIFNSSTSSSPSVDVTFFGVAVNYLTIQQVILDLEENQHDLARVFIAGIPAKAATDYIGAPVAINWFQGVSGHVFHGVVSHIEPEFQSLRGHVNNSLFQVAVVYCFGSSFQMKAKVTKVWTDSSLFGIIQQIASKYQFSFSIPKDSFIFPRLVQSGESDWEFLVRVVKSLGYSVTLHGTHIHVFDRFKATGRQLSVHELSTWNVNGGARSRPGMIYDMQSTLGKVTPTSNVNNEEFIAFDNNGVVTPVGSGQRTSGLGRTLTPEFTDQIPMNLATPEFAQRTADARNRTKYPFNAELQLVGVAGVLPGGVVDVKRFDSRVDGLWYVSKVKQMLTLDKFLTHLTVLKDATNEEPFSINAATKVTDPPSSVFVNGAWRATTQMEETYG